MGPPRYSENTIAKIINPDQARLSTKNSLLRAPFIIIEIKHQAMSCHERTQVVNFSKGKRWKIPLGLVIERRREARKAASSGPAFTVGSRRYILTFLCSGSKLHTPAFLARSCLDKVPGRAPFSQLSKQATAYTIQMQIVKQINENELDNRKLMNQLCSKFHFFLLDAAWVRSRADRPSVSYTKVSAVSLGLANSCNYTSRNKFKQNSGSNKFQIAGDGKMKRMREP